MVLRVLRNIIIDVLKFIYRVKYDQTDKEFTLSLELNIAPELVTGT
jgi:hypothetical protein